MTKPNKLLFSRSNLYPLTSQENMSTPQKPSIESLSSTLNQLSAGERGWFWMCTQVATEDPCIVITPFTAGNPKPMYDAAATIERPLAVVPIVGVAAVGSDGRLNFASMFLEQEDLPRLADWTQKNIEKYPALSRLRDTILVQLSQDHKILNRFEDASLWEGIEKPVVPGTAAAELRILSKFKPGRKAWYWMTDKGPDGKPFFFANSSKVAPEKFAAEVTKLQLRIPQNGKTAFGYVEVNKNNVLVFTSQSDADDGMQILKALQESYADDASALQTARFLQMDGARIIKVGRPVSASEPTTVIDLSAMSNVLAKMTEQSNSIAFWFTSAAKDGQPMLVISDDKKQIKSQAMAAGGSGDTIRGVVKQSSKGWVEFRVKDAYPKFVEAIAGFVSKYHEDWPSLRRLKGARMIQRQGDAIVDRQKNDKVWSHIPST